MNQQTLANRLFAAAVAVEHSGAHANRESLLELCRIVQSALAPRPEEMTWHSYDGRIWKPQEMSHEHLINALSSLARRSAGSMSPLFPVLRAEVDRRVRDLDLTVGVREWMAGRAAKIDHIAKILGWPSLQEQEQATQASRASRSIKDPH